MKYATIGTGKIVEQFIEAADQIMELEYVLCYSRKTTTAQDFVRKTDHLETKITTDFNQILQAKIDFVYIASPNGLHYQQAKFFLENKINVLVEKPATFLASEIEELKLIANHNKVILMEAMKTIHTEQFKILQKMLESFKVNSAVFNLNQYTSRMGKIEQKIFDSVFDAKLGKGNVYDLLVYPVQLAIALFGPIKTLKSIGNKLANDVSICDHVILQHKNLIITSISSSKHNYQTIDSQIFAQDKSIKLKNLTSLEQIIIDNYILRVAPIILQQDVNKHVMHGEIVDFINLINHSNFQLMNQWLDITIATIKVLEKIA